MSSQPQLTGLIGQPVAHSISPLFQQAAFDALGIDARYERWETAAEALPVRVGALRAPGFLGANVTVPHKESVQPMLDEADETAYRAGAINTIVNRDGRLLGYNTDVAGFRRALREVGGFDAAGKRAVVLGSGGAARAVVLALEQEGAATVCVANRHADRAVRLVDDLRSDGGPTLVALEWQQAVSADILRSANLLINCTSIGLAGTARVNASPIVGPVLDEHLFVCDLVANPLLTPLLRQARDAGARGLGGLAMLVYQGADSFERWTGQAAPLAIMMRAAESAMGAAAGAGK